jgi:hypothetical protein
MTRQMHTRKPRTAPAAWFGGEEVEFPVTRHELHALAEYWWTERIDHDFWFFLYQQTGSRP